jgi:hypothetical protein
VTGDHPPGPNPIALLFRHVLEARARTLFPAGSRVLDLSHAGPEAGAPFDGAYAGPGALDEVDLRALGRALAAELRPGAPVLLCLRSRGSATDIPGPRRVRARLGPEFTWHRTFALGVLVPEESRQDWTRRNPQAFGVLAAMERVVRGWPLVRSLGQYAVIEGRRR